MPERFSSMPKSTAKTVAEAIVRKKAGEDAEAKEIDVKSAAHIAASYLLELIPAVRNRNVLLEEVDQTDDGRYWLITLGYNGFATGAAILRPGSGREYKTFKLDARTGKVLKMKIRSID